MNCANHSMNPAAAYCRTCGKPLCSNCTRQVMGVIYCENCLSERLGSTPPPSPYRPAAGVPMGVQAQGPHPVVAGILGSIPFGVGAIYCGQYTKGLVHLGIFVFLVVAQMSNVPDYLHVILGFAIAFFVFYQIVDAVRSAKAIQAGQPVPDPFGLTAAFNPGGKAVQRTDFYKGVPAGAVILIVLGVLFLLHNLGLWFLRPGVVWSFLLIGLGIWLFARRFESAEPGCRTRGIVGPAILVTIGLQSLLDNLDIVSFARTLPALLIVIGLAIIVQRTTHGHYPPQSPPSESNTPPSGPMSDASDPTEVKNG